MSSSGRSMAQRCSDFRRSGSLDERHRVGLSWPAAQRWTRYPLPTGANAEEVVRGQRARLAHDDPAALPHPTGLVGGYTSLFALQQKESAPTSM